MNSRVLCIIGSVLILIGLFLPRVSIFGIDISYFDSIKSASGPQGFIFLGLGVISLILALINKTRFLIATGILTLVYLILAFIDYRSTMNEVTRGISLELTSQLGGLIQLRWGLAVLLFGGLLLLVAGIINKSATRPTPTYAAPPPSPDYARRPEQPAPYNR